MCACRNSACASRPRCGRYHVASTTRIAGAPSRWASHSGLTIGPRLASVMARFVSGSTGPIMTRRRASRDATGVRPARDALAGRRGVQKTAEDLAPQRERLGKEQPGPVTVRRQAAPLFELVLRPEEVEDRKST